MAVNFGKHAGLVGVAVLVVTAGLGFGATKLEFATGQDSYLNSDDRVYIDNVAYQDLFGGQAMLTLFTMDEGTTVVDLFTPANIEKIQAVEGELNGTEGVLSVVTPLTALQFTQDLVTKSPSGELTDDPTASVAGVALLGAQARETAGSPEAKARLDDALATVSRLNEIPVADRNFENPAWVEFLLIDNQGDIRKALRPFFPDDRHAQLVTRVEGNADLETEGTAAEAIQAIFEGQTFDNASVLTTGAPVLLKEINDYLRGGFLSLGAIAVALMVVILLVTFRVRWRLLSLGVILVGVIWAFGLAGYLGIPLSVVTISGLPVLLGIGIDFAIQFHSRVEEEVQLDRSPHPIQETTTQLVPALVVATVAAAIAFLALQLAEVPMIRHFGVLLAVGILVVLVADVVLPTAILGAREYRSPTTPRDFTHDVISRLVVRLGSLPRAAVPVLIVLSIAVFAGGAAVDGSLELQTDPEEWVDQGSAVIGDLDTLRTEVGSSSELGIYVQSDDIFSDETVGFVHDFATGELSKYPDDLLTASSLVTTVSFLLEVPGTTVLPPTGEDVANAYAVAPEAIRSSTVNEESGALNIIFRTGASSLERRAVVVNDIRATVAPPAGVKATPSGLAVVGVGLLENLKANRTLLTQVALGAVFVFLLLRLRHPVRAILCMVPVLMGVGATSIVASVAGFKLSPLTALGGPLVIAACTEFTSLILLRHLEERERGLSPIEAAHVAESRTGRAFVASALAIITGVVVLVASPLPLLRDFGLITSVNVAVALLSALVVLPPLLIWADEHGWLHADGTKPEEPAPEAVPAQA
jgi:hydrophobe/amphiphile efflux-3 (HAE3) family protein